ncbi:hypothetical protein [Aestuariivirga sp.]|uniref:hypothetical protein n=1 Tax=Aestuariivirga sp. TaxID=2650926 RepID=UPI0039E5BCCC
MARKTMKQELEDLRAELERVRKMKAEDFLPQGLSPEMQQKVDDLRGKVTDAQDKVQGLLTDARDATKANPLAAVAGALVVGFVIGSLLR